MSDDDYDFEAACRDSGKLVDQIRPILAMNGPEETGAAIAQLLAIFIAGNAPPLREGARTMLLDCADNLMPIMVEEMIEAGRAPPEWRQGNTQ